MTASALLRHGPMYAADMLDGLAGWMSRKGFCTLADVRSLLAVPADAHESARGRAVCNALRAANIGTGQW